MVQVVLNADQTKLLTDANDRIEIVDPNGNRLETFVRPPSDEQVQVARQLVSDDGKR